ncbi:MAG TPA: glycoside hydrolase family 130 protein [Sumerlaeia bacterium]|nr:glycoside hydrolase family 130 protein [Sumerlaeia bacterium]
MAQRKRGKDLLHRWEENPIISVENVPFRANTVFNGTPIVTDDGIYILLRVEGQQGYSFFLLARSADGLHFHIDEKPAMVPATEGPFAPYECKGIEDPRVTFIDGVCYVVYTAVGDCGPRIALARTDDYANYERIALISEPGNKDGVLFPRKVNGLYARLDRPIGQGVGSIWVSYSPDLVNWGDSEVVISPRSGYWDEYRIGASVPPIETPEGWLEIYHGVKMTSAGPIYRIGAVLMDLDDPANVIKRGSAPVLSPREHYERIGDIPNVCFACGAVLDRDGAMKIYYGAADTSICVALTTLDELMEKGFDDPSGFEEE